MPLAPMRVQNPTYVGLSLSCPQSLFDSRRFSAVPVPHNAYRLLSGVGNTPFLKSRACQMLLVI